MRAPGTAGLNCMSISWFYVEGERKCIIFGKGYESLNGNLRLVLLTRVSMTFYHPNASTGNSVNAFLLTVRLCFVVFIN